MADWINRATRNQYASGSVIAVCEVIMAKAMRPAQVLES